ncbi:MAG: DNA polymerase/3'-5' exonuclease PolX [Halobacteriota archaeon]
MTRNEEVATLLESFADLLDAKGVEYKPRSYRRAAENIRDHARPIEDLAREGQDAVEEIDGVGDAISSKIVEYFETGEVAELEALREELPVDMAALTSVEGIGPKTVGSLYEALGITTLDELEAAARAGDIRVVKGFGAKTEENILENVPFARQAQERQLLGDARPLADDVLAFFGSLDVVEQAAVAGSIRRWRDTIGDVDVLVATEDAERVVDAFTDWNRVGRLIEAGSSKASVRVSDIRIDLRVVVPDEFGAALQYFTGSKDHNVHLRNIAIDRGLKMNEYGVFDVSNVDEPDTDQRVGERIAGRTEAEMYAALDLPLITPELREDTGEIEAAREGALPEPLTVEQIRGDLHTHTEWSDGDNTVAEMIEAAADFGYDYHCVSDHAVGPGMVGGVGLTADEVRAQMDEVRSAAADTDIEVFHGVEVNIDSAGALSLPNDLLDELDIVVASPHSSLDQSREEATDRLVRAVEHPSVDVLGHPTGRLINRRPGLSLNLERLAKAAVDSGTALELNANPHRLDLNGEAIRVVVDAGATVVIDTDAHRPSELEYVRYGVHTARRGWVEAPDVLNTRDAGGVRAFLH